MLDEATVEGTEPLGPLVYQAYCDQPLVQTNIIVLSKEKLELENVTVEDKTLVSENDCNLIIGTKILQRAMVRYIILIYITPFLNYDFIGFATSIQRSKGQRIHSISRGLRFRYKFVVRTRSSWY